MRTLLLMAILLTAVSCDDGGSSSSDAMDDAGADAAMDSSVDGGQEDMGNGEFEFTTGNDDVDFAVTAYVETFAPAAERDCACWLPPSDGDVEACEASKSEVDPLFFSSCHAELFGSAPEEAVTYFECLSEYQDAIDECLPSLCPEDPDEVVVTYADCVVSANAAVGGNCIDQRSEGFQDDFRGCVED